jgi:hypothetical protein
MPEILTREPFDHFLFLEGMEVVDSNGIYTKRTNYFTVRFPFSGLQDAQHGQLAADAKQHNIVVRLSYIYLHIARLDISQVPRALKQRMRLWLLFTHTAHVYVTMHLVLQMLKQYSTSESRAQVLRDNLASVLVDGFPALPDLPAAAKAVRVNNRAPVKAQFYSCLATDSYNK